VTPVQVEILRAAALEAVMPKKGRGDKLLRAVVTLDGSMAVNDASRAGI
jgi:hypothetical protein